MFFRNSLFSDFDLLIDNKPIDKFFDDTFKKYEEDLNFFKSLNRNTVTSSNKNNKKADTSMEEQKAKYFAKMLSQPKLSLEKHEEIIDNLIREYLKKNEKEFAAADTGIITMQFADAAFGWLYDKKTRIYSGYVLDIMQLNNCTRENPLIKDLKDKTPDLYYYVETNKFFDAVGNDLDEYTDDTDNKEEAEKSCETDSLNTINESADKLSDYSEIFEALYKALEPFAEELTTKEKQGKSIVKEFYDEFWNIFGGKSTLDDEDIDSLYDDENLTKDNRKNVIDNKDDKTTLCDKFKNKFDKIKKEKENQYDVRNDEGVYVPIFVDAIVKYLYELLNDEKRLNDCLRESSNDVCIGFLLKDVNDIENILHINTNFLTLEDIPNNILKNIAKVVKKETGFINVTLSLEPNTITKIGKYIECICKIK